MSGLCAVMSEKRLFDRVPLLASCCGVLRQLVCQRRYANGFALARR
jgi:hypothetical protein